MSEYTAARNRTRAKIERAFWDLYLEKKFRRVTVQEIVQRAGIHRSTFYIYFQAVEDIFSAIKERQLSLLQEVLATEGEGNDRFIGLLNALREVYEENRIFLKPLVIDYHSSSFSRAYRQMLKDCSCWIQELSPWRKLSTLPITPWKRGLSRPCRSSSGSVEYMCRCNK